jgi:hypothetical protein
MEIETRRPVWVAFSELFLDTDVTLFYASIAKALVECPYSIEELRAILFIEVLPVLQGKMFATAGVWDGFDEEWLMTRAAKRVGKKALMRLPFVSSYVRKHWEQLVPLILELRAKS